MGNFRVLTVLLVIATCAVHIQASPYRPFNLADQDLDTFLNQLRDSLVHEEQEVRRQKEAEMMQMQRRCAPWTRYEVTEHNKKFAFECCIANGRLCLDPTENVPVSCGKTYEEGSCKEVVWRISWWKSYSFQICLEAGRACLKNSKIMECGKDLLNQANTASVVLCHNEEDGKKDCINDGDIIDSSTDLSQMLDPKSSCFCIKGDRGLNICSPKGCKPDA